MRSRALKLGLQAELTFVGAICCHVGYVFELLIEGCLEVRVGWEQAVRLRVSKAAPQRAQQHLVVLRLLLGCCYDLAQHALPSRFGNSGHIALDTGVILGVGQDL